MDVHRRRRQSVGIRQLCSESVLDPASLIWPIFVKDGLSSPMPITSLPGQSQWPVSQLAQALEAPLSHGLNAVMIFGVPATKDAKGSDALSDLGVVQQAIRFIKSYAPHLVCIADLCFCQYTDHGHCGVLADTACVDHPKTLPLLVEQACSLAEAGADVLAPSGMLDGAVEAIRQGLDQAAYAHTAIMSYAVKYASAWYGPFRDATEGSVRSIDRRTHQMNPANGDEALLAAERDMHAGCDMLLVKPGLAYLDCLYRVATAWPAWPVGVYHVSGEYAAIKAMAAMNQVDEKALVMEVHTGFFRAGARFIVSYYTPEILSWLQK